MADIQTEGLTFEKVWAMFQNTDRKILKLKKQIKETGKQIGYLGNRFGELAEHLVLPSIKKKFKALGFIFDKTTNGTAIKDAQDRYQGADIDIMLENGDFAIAIEVKAKTAYKDVDRHMERMAVLRRWADRHNDKRTFHGAVAGAIMTDEVKAYAQKQGFYTIVQTGDTVKIDIPEDFVPRNW